MITHLALLAIRTLSLVQAAPLPLSEALRLARERSPEVRQLQAQVESAEQKSWAAIAPAEPTLALMDGDLTKGFRPDTAASRSISLTQPIGLPGRAWLQRSQNQDVVRALESQRDALAGQLEANVKTAYFNLQMGLGQVQLNEETRAAFQRVLEIARRRFESGGTAQVDFINAQVALLANENDLADLRANENSLRTQLTVLTGTEGAFEIEPIQMVRYPKVDLKRAAEKLANGRPEIRAARATFSASEKSYRLAWLSGLPDFSLTVGTTKYREPYASPYSGALAYQGAAGPASQPPADPSWPTRTYSIGLQFTIPIWFLLNERSTIDGAARDRAAAARGVDVQVNQSRILLESTVGTINALEEKVDRFERRMIPLSDQAFRLGLTDYSSGRINFQTLSDTAVARRQTRAAYYAAITSYRSNWAIYEQLVGRDELAHP